MGWDGMGWTGLALSCDCVQCSRKRRSGFHTCVCVCPCKPVRVCPVLSVSVSLQHAAETYERARVGGFCSSQNRMPQDRIGQDRIGLAGALRRGNTPSSTFTFLFPHAHAHAHVPARARAKAKAGTSELATQLSPSRRNSNTWPRAVPYLLFVASRGTISYTIPRLVSSRLVGKCVRACMRVVESRVASIQL
jgi:hypothetical protein